MKADLAPVLATQFSIGQVIRKTLRIFRRNFLKFSLVACAFELLLVMPSLTGDTGELTISEAPRRIDWWSYALELSVGIVANGLRDAALTFGSFQVLRGHVVSLGDLFRGLRFVVPMVGVAAILHVPFAGADVYETVVSGDFDGVSLIIGVGGVVLVVIWFLAAPLIVVERIGVLPALRRSAALTRGKRWEIFGLLMLTVIFFLLLDFLIEILDPTQSDAAAMGSPAFWLTQCLSPALLGAFMAILAVVSYHVIRSEQEGATSQEVARIFD